MVKYRIRKFPDEFTIERWQPEKIALPYGQYNQSGYSIAPGWVKEKAFKYLADAQLWLTRQKKLKQAQENPVILEEWEF